jgi:predicted peptidase
MGGYGTFHILAQEPKLFAAGVPIAGGGIPGSASEMKKVPLWVFHGAKDLTVKFSQSQNMVEALKKARAKVKYTEYPDGDQGIVGEVLRTKELHEWLFEQSRTK